MPARVPEEQDHAEQQGGQGDSGGAGDADDETDGGDSNASSKRKASYMALKDALGKLESGD